MQQILRVGEAVRLTDVGALRHNKVLFRAPEIQWEVAVIKYYDSKLQYCIANTRNDRISFERIIEQGVGIRMVTPFNQLPPRLQNYAVSTLHGCNGLINSNTGRWVYPNEIEVVVYDDGVDNWI